MKILSVAFFIVLAAGGAGLRARAGEDSRFPAVPGWTLAPPPGESVYTPDNLWDCIDGGAELFLSYGFVDLHIGEYTDAAGTDVRVELYRLSSGTNAFGIYSQERNPGYQFIDIGTQGYVEEKVLNFLSGVYYVKMSSHRQGKTGIDAMEAIGRRVADALHQERGWPLALALLPAEKRLANTESYSAENYLGYADFRSAFSARYEGNVTLFLMDFGSRTRAHAAAIAYLNRAASADSLTEGSITDVSDPHNGSVAMLLVGRFVCGATGGEKARAHRYMELLQRGLPPVESGGKRGIYMITDYGAVPGPESVNTRAIQDAVDDCGAHGGGTVVVPPGEFVTGTIRLKSNVHLSLESGAVLKGTRLMSGYYLAGIRRGILFADDAADITISGRGCIDGNGTSFFHTDRLNPAGVEKQYTRQGEEYMDPKFGGGEGPIACDARPGMMVDFLRCSNIAIRDVTLKDSPEYCVRIGTCENVVISGVTVANNPLIPNNDGIHCTTSRNVRISDCHVVAGDDAIIVTGFPYDMDSTGLGKAVPASNGNRTNRAEYVVVTNCTLSSRSVAIRVGYGDNDIRNCTFQNIVIENSNRGIGVFARDTGSIRNILFSGIIIESRLFTGGWWGAGEPIHVSAVPETKGVRVGSIDGITFDNIRAESESGIVLCGVGPCTISHIVLNNVRLVVKGGPLDASYGGHIDLRPAWSGESRVFRHDIPGLYARHITDSRIDNFTLSWEGRLPPFYTHGIAIDSSTAVDIRGFRGNHAPGAQGAKPVETQGSKRITIKE